MNGKFVSSVWILLKAGVIKKFIIWIKLKNINVIGITQRFKHKDRIKHSFIGTEKQVFLQNIFIIKK